MSAQTNLQPGVPTSIKKEASNLHILKLSMTYFATGMIMFLVAMVSAISIWPELVRAESMRMPEGWFLAHLLLLGFATTIAMGASFQLIQVIMRVSLFSRAMGYYQYVLFTLGYVAMIVGFMQDGQLIVFGGTSVALAGLLYAVNLFMTFMSRKEWNVFVLGICLSVVAFLLTIILGIRLGVTFAYDGYSSFYEMVLESHLWFGVAGWLSGFIVIFSMKLLPMFYISSKKPGRDAYWIIGLLHGGIWLHTLAVWIELESITIVSIVMMVVSLGWFIVYVYAIRSQSRSKRPVGVISIALHLIPVVFILFLIWFGYGLMAERPSQLHDMLITMLVLGWFAPTILSYLSKILPFLWWAHRFQTKEEKKGAVLLTNMLPERRMSIQLLGYLSGISIVIIGYMLGMPNLTIGGQIIAVALSVVYLLELTRTFRY
jgi:hypothetical protein